MGNGASPVVQRVKTPLTIQETQETWVWFLGWEDHLEEKMTTHSSILSWKIPWTEETDRLLSMGLQRVRSSWYHINDTNFTISRPNLLAEHLLLLAPLKPFPGTSELPKGDSQKFINIFLVLFPRAFQWYLQSSNLKLEFLWKCYLCAGCDFLVLQKLHLMIIPNSEWCSSILSFSPYQSMAVFHTALAKCANCFWTLCHILPPVLSTAIVETLVSKTPSEPLQ